MKVYVVWYDSRPTGRYGVDETRHIDSVFDTVEKARSRVAELEQRFGFYADFDSYDVE